MESNHTINITKDYKVIVGCMTYNHSKYIVDALNGFAMQQTDFPFACIVMDDASTDGEQEVIKNWLHNECDMARAEYYDLELSDVIIVPHKENANCTMALYFLKKKLNDNQESKYFLLKDWFFHSEYLAFCDGDDYWVSPNKLKYQAACLDENKGIDICLHGYSPKDANSSIVDKAVRFSERECVIPLSEIIMNLRFCPASGSIFIRSKLLQNLPEFVRFFTLDYSILIYGAINGGAYYIPEIMSVYRTNVASSEMKKVNSNPKYRKTYIEKLTQMLHILDNDLKYKYHNEILASILLKSTHHSNSPVQNIHIVRKYYAGFTRLPFTYKIKLITKCICPKFAHMIICKLSL